MLQLFPPIYQQSVYQRIHRFVILALILLVLCTCRTTVSSKRHICLFTCASTRAVHLELTLNLNVPSFLLAFRRFVGQRGLPNTLLSDNAKTFHVAAKEICTIIQSTEVQQYFTNHQISWKFSIERAPWWGEFWERMVKPSG